MSKSAVTQTMSLKILRYKELLVYARRFSKQKP
nr:MAG TPA: hypothetical protein [Caudoviricetes sp.]